MVDVTAALAYLDKLWNEEKGAFKEAVTLDRYWKDDNWLAWLVMKKHNPEKAAILREGFILDYTDPRWCILDGDLENFVQSPDVLPDWYRYADLLALQFMYEFHSGNKARCKQLYAYLQAMRCLVGEGESVGDEEIAPSFYLYDTATPREGYTTYKLSLYAMCSTLFKHVDEAKNALHTVDYWQLGPDDPRSVNDEEGGIKTEYWPEDWEKPGYILSLANCETTCIGIIAHEALLSEEALAIGLNAATIGVVGISSLSVVIPAVRRAAKK